MQAADLRADTLVVTLDTTSRDVVQAMALAVAAEGHPLRQATPFDATYLSAADGAALGAASKAARLESRHVAQSGSVHTHVLWRAPSWAIEAASEGEGEGGVAEGGGGVEGAATAAEKGGEVDPPASHAHLALLGIVQRGCLQLIRAGFADQLLPAAQVGREPPSEVVGLPSDCTFETKVRASVEGVAKAAEGEAVEEAAAAAQKTAAAQKAARARAKQKAAREAAAKAEAEAAAELHELLGRLELLEYEHTFEAHHIGAADLEALSEGPDALEPSDSFGVLLLPSDPARHSQRAHARASAGALPLPHHSMPFH